MRRTASGTFCLFVALLLVAPATAAERVIAITGGTVHTPDGPVEGATVLIKGDRIDAVGTELVVPDGAEVIDADGKIVTPGFIAFGTGLGLVEVGLESSTVDASAAGDPVRASFDVFDAYNPRSSLIPIARSGGVTTALIAPGGGLISGLGSVVDLRGDSQAEALFGRSEEERLWGRSVTLHMRLGGMREGSRAQTLSELEELFAAARRFESDPRQYAQSGLRHPHASAADLRVLSAVLDGRVPLVVQVSRASDIEALLRVTDRYGIRLIIVGAHEAWMLADDLAEREVAVALNPLDNAPGSFDSLAARADNAAILDAAGVRVIISYGGTWGSHNLRKLRQFAGNAVRAGMDYRSALDALTAHPGWALSQSNPLERPRTAASPQQERGRLVPGAVANVVVWSGDPLELSSKVDAVLVHGEPQSLESRQTELRDRYMELPGTPAPPLPLP